MEFGENWSNDNREEDVLRLDKFLHISLERPRVLKNAAKLEIGLDIYLWNTT